MFIHKPQDLPFSASIPRSGHHPTSKDYPPKPYIFASDSNIQTYSSFNTNHKIYHSQHQSLDPIIYYPKLKDHPSKPYVSASNSNTHIYSPFNLFLHTDSNLVVPSTIQNSIDSSSGNNSSHDPHQLAVLSLHNISPQRPTNTNTYNSSPLYSLIPADHRILL